MLWIVILWYLIYKIFRCHEMSFIVTKKIGGRDYVYEITSFWDSEKGKSRKKSLYLGIRALDGTVSKKKDLKILEKTNALGPVAPMYDFGPFYFLSHLVDQVGMLSSLSSVFDSETVRSILSLVYFQVIEARSFHLYDTWRAHCDPDFLQPLSSQRITELLLRIAEHPAAIHTFFQLFAKFHGPAQGVWLDITSISSYRSPDAWFEHGYNRDRERLPQVNLGMLMGSPMHLPMFYELYPGSVNDVSTLKNVAYRAKELNIAVETWVMDRGFFSTSNVDNMVQEGYHFVIGLPGSLKASKKLLNQIHPKSPLHFFSSKKKLIFYAEDSCEVGSHTLRAITYFQEHRYSQEADTFLNHLIDIEDKIESMSWDNVSQAQEYILEVAKHSDIIACLHCEEKDGKICVTRNPEAINAALNRKGKFILVTNHPSMQAEDVLEKYKQKDRVEKIFDTLKHDLSAKRFRNHSDRTMQGKMFINFLSIILNTLIKNKLRPQRQNKKPVKMGVKEILLNLKTLRSQKRSNNQPPIISEVTAKQKAVFKLFDIPLPF